MFGKWSGNIARRLAKRAGTPAPESTAARATDPASSAAPGMPADHAMGEPSGSVEPPAPQVAPSLEDTAATSPETTNESRDEAAEAEDQSDEPGSECSDSDSFSDTAAPTTAPVPLTGREPGSGGQKVVTLVSLVEHAGAKTVAAALAGRARDKGWTLRTSGPGLMRAAFSGMLNDTGALVLVAPPEPAVTSVLGEKLAWFQANGRPALAGKTVFVINLGASQQGSGGPSGLELPADPARPVVLLPFDTALCPGTPARAPRRAARHALDQLVEELSTIFQEH